MTTGNILANISDIIQYATYFGPEDYRQALK